MILTKWQWRADTAANWTASNPTLAAGEIGFEKDTLGLKVGDGVTAWVTLPYLFPVGGLLSTVGGLITASQGVVTGAITSAVSAVEGYLSGTTVPAIGALLAPVRIADAGNSSVAALGVGGVFTGVWHRTDGPGGVWARIDLALTVAGTATLAVQHSDDGVNPIAALTETWVAAAAAHPSFPTELKRTWVRVVLTDTSGAPNAVTLAATLDPRPLDHFIPIQTTLIGNIASGASVTTVAPVGARRFVSAVRDFLLPEQTLDSIRVSALGVRGYASLEHCLYGERPLMELSPNQSVKVFNFNARAADAILWFYP